MLTPFILIGSSEVWKLRLSLSISTNFSFSMCDIFWLFMQNIFIAISSMLSFFFLFSEIFLRQLLPYSPFCYLIFAYFYFSLFFFKIFNLFILTRFIYCSSTPYFTFKKKIFCILCFIIIELTALELRKTYSLISLVILTNFKNNFHINSWSYC